jgi:PAS domain S-box-containing protein
MEDYGLNMSSSIERPEDDLRTVVDLTPFMLARCSADLRYRFVSDACAKMLGYRPADIVGQRIVDILGEEGFREILPYIQEVLKGNRSEYETDVHYKSVGKRHVRVIYVPERDPLGNVQGWVASIVDLTAQRSAERRIAADLLAMTLLRDIGGLCMRDDAAIADCLQGILEGAIAITRAKRGNIQLLDPDTGELSIAVQHGFDERFLKFFERVRDDASACARATRGLATVIVEDVLSSEIFAEQPSKQVLLDSGVRAIISTPLISSRRALLGIISAHFPTPHSPTQGELHFIDLLARQAADYLERKRAQETEKGLLRELQHRSNNLLAIIHTIANRTFSDGLSLPDARDAFEGRLHALAKANKLVTSSNGTALAIDRVLRIELEPFIARASFQGPVIMLNPRHAQSLALGLHELVTNAAKYGALSNGMGNVKVSWSLIRDGIQSRLKLRWQESDGPAVVAPSRRGFGTSLLESSFPAIKIDYAEDGLVCELEIMLGAEQEPEEAPV